MENFIFLCSISSRIANSFVAGMQLLFESARVIVTTTFLLSQDQEENSTGERRVP